MKKRICMFLCFVLVTTTCCLSFVACQSEGIVLKKHTEPFDLHTELQSYYLEYILNSAYQPDAEVDEVKGTADLSKPLPVVLEWTDESGCGEYVVEISQTQDFADKITVNTTEKKAEVYNLKIATSYYWRVIGGDETSEVGVFETAGNGPRNMYVDGVTNFRDVGGWLTSSGKRVKQGLLYRSARFNRSYAIGMESSYTEPTEVLPEITAQGIAEMKRLGIKIEVDFRLDHRNGFPEGITPYSMIDGVTYVSLPMKGNAAATGDNAEKVKTLMEMLADENNYPLVYHCNIGTDRTGLVSYLIGALCGVSEEDLLKDYLFSNFGNIGELKSPSNSKNTFIGLTDYTGDTLQKRAEAYFQSIGVSKQIYEAVRNILLED